MNFKDQLAADMENTFMNPNELADSVTIDGIEASGFLLERSGNEGELVYVLKVASSTDITSESVIVANGKTYGVMSDINNDGFGGVTVILGDPV